MLATAAKEPIAMTQTVTRDVRAPLERENWSDRLVYPILLAAVIGMFCMLVAGMAIYCATLDAPTALIGSDTLVLASLVGASLVIMILTRELVIACLSFSKLFDVPPRPVSGNTPMPLVSVVVPAYNEGSAIEDTLRSVLALDYPRLEVIVVDDGSTDDTLVKSRRIADAAGDVKVEVISQPNSGKWKALNEGIARSTGELVLCVDADSIIERDSLRHMVPHFSDPEVAAVSGQVQIRNQHNLVTRLQALEYVVANGSTRTSQGQNGCVLIVPGPIGLFRRSSLDEVSRAFFAGAGEGGSSRGNGPFSPHTFAEDFELSVMLCVRNGKVVYEPRARSLTQAPDTIQALLGQRYRWLRGSMQVASRYHGEGWARLCRNPSVRRWMTLTTICDLYLIPLAGLLLLGTMVTTFVAGELQSMLPLWLMVWSIQAGIAAMFIRSHGERLSLALLAPLQSIYAVVLLLGVWSHAAFDHASSRPMEW
ncbi:MAG: glycosyltransferase [Hyphomicrobiaceae bacterium]|nr:glycosyltransferase [Hyphomicrobiaceae bacterium]